MKTKTKRINLYVYGIRYNYKDIMEAAFVLCNYKGKSIRQAAKLVKKFHKDECVLEL